VSEQPTSAYGQSDYAPRDEGTRFSGDGQDRLDFHRHTVPKYDTAAIEAGRRAYEAYDTPAETVEISPVSLASRRLQLLHQARLAQMRPEDTPFLKDAA
jgi:hypothetical protein